VTTTPYRKRTIYFAAVVTIFICIGISLLVSRALVDARILRPNWFTDGFTNPSEWIAKWLRNPTCKVPCWENITPGETNRDQAKSLLSSNPEVASVEEGDVIPYGLMLFVKIYDGKNKGNVSIKFDNQNIAQEIELAVFGDNLYLHDMITVYGPPKKVLFHNQDYEYVTVDLLYPELGLIIELFLHNLNLEGEIPKVKIEKYEEILYAYLDAPGLKYFFDTSGIVDSSLLYEWKGYTTYP
jgi:hypothetical protein